MLTGVNICLSIAIAVCAATASRYWYRSALPARSKTTEPDASVEDATVLHILSTQVDIYEIHRTLSEASLLNKKAAKWSAWAAGLGAIVVFTSMLP